ncbi:MULTISPECIES: hypothetical protein [unclassified Streptomyces]|uniref:hypothetical protein n=1 Tax=unclassified Streptomyces TaxID=2593676 RepID=UPI00168AE8C5|nr:MULTISPECIES: hypothetical protein [unclassified Streptomyces]MBD3003947.1 hypothetical protein [Streptomyces sp. 5-10]
MGVATVNTANPTRLVQQLVHRVDGLPAGIRTIRLVRKNGQYLMTDRFTFR